MQKHNTKKEKSSSSNRRHKPEGEEERVERLRLVRCAIIANNVDNSRKSQEKNMSKEDINLAKAGKLPRHAAESETTLKRLKRRFLRKNSTKVPDEKELHTGSSEHRRQAGIYNASTSKNLPQQVQDHVYDVPFKNCSSFEEDSEDDHVYENGYVWAANNIPKRNSARFRNKSESDKETRNLHENGSVSCSESTFDGCGRLDNHVDEPNNKGRWQQGKSMSLPATKASKAKPSEFPGLASLHRKSSCDISSDENCEDPETESPSALPSDSLFIRSQSLPVPSKMNFSHHFLTGLNDLCKCGWYWGPLNSKDAEVKLHGKPDGTFLVRDSNDNRYLLSLSFRSEGKTLHTRIEFCKGKFSFYAAPFVTSGCHESIVDLIEDCVDKSKEKVFCYSKGRGHNGAAFPVRLMRAYSRFEHVCSLQHLCRFIIRQHFTLENIGEMQLPGMVKKYLWKNHFDAKDD